MDKKSVISQNKKLIKNMDYQVMECRYRYSTDDANTLFATKAEQEAIESAKEFGCGTVVVRVDESVNKERI